MAKSPFNSQLATQKERADYAAYAVASRGELLKQATTRGLAAAKLGLGKEDLIQALMAADG